MTDAIQQQLNGFLEAVIEHAGDQYDVSSIDLRGYPVGQGASQMSMPELAAAYEDHVVYAPMKNLAGMNVAFSPGEIQMKQLESGLIVPDDIAQASGQSFQDYTGLAYVVLG